MNINDFAVEAIRLTKRMKRYEYNIRNDIIGRQASGKWFQLLIQNIFLSTSLSLHKVDNLQSVMGQ